MVLQFPVFSGYAGFLRQQTDRLDKTEILLKVALDTITLTLTPISISMYLCYILKI